MSNLRTYEPRTSDCKVTVGKENEYITLTATPKVGSSKWELIMPYEDAKIIVRAINFYLGVKDE